MKKGVPEGKSEAAGEAKKPEKKEEAGGKDIFEPKLVISLAIVIVVLLAVFAFMQMGQKSPAEEVPVIKTPEEANMTAQKVTEDVKSVSDTIKDIKSALS